MLRASAARASSGGPWPSTRASNTGKSRTYVKNSWRKWTASCSFVSPGRVKCFHAEARERAVARDLDDLGARVVVLVDAVAEAHEAKLRLLVFRHGDELLDAAAVGLDALEHLDDFLVGTAVERAPQRADAGRDRG